MENLLSRSHFPTTVRGASSPAPPSQEELDRLVARVRVRPEPPEEAVPISGESPYPHYSPGTYQAQCMHACIYRDPQFRRWTARLEFQLLPEGGHVFGFRNLGTDPKPKAGPRSEYRRDWVMANGEPPRRRQQLSPRVFKDKVFEVRVVDVTKRFDGREHPPGAIYSTVKEILRRLYP